MAIALALLMIPMLGSGATAEDAMLPQDESVGQAEEQEVPPPAEEIEEAAEEVAPPAEEQSEPKRGEEAASLAVSAEEGEVAAAAAGVCDTNIGNGKVSSFAQNTKEDSSGSWINGALNQTNSDYAEGDWVPQRVEMSGLNGGEHELVFTYDVTKNGKYAYDEVGQSSMTGGTITAWTVENDGGPTATVHVTFEVPDGTNLSATLYFAGHIARELDWGADMGAGSISGAPYHISLQTLNCASAGQQDNQLMADAVDAGELTVIKEATPADGTDFTFSIVPGGAASTFLLDDDGDATLPDRRTYRVAPDSYTVEEIGIPAGWSLTGIECTDTPTGSTATSRTVSISDDEEVSCTFTNSKIQYADLMVSKTATTSYDRDYDWTITKEVDGASKKYDADGTASFDYDVVVTPGTPQDSNFQVSGLITVSNPNTVAFAGVSLKDQLDGEDCTITNLDGSAFTQPFSVPAGGKVEVKYVCDLPDGSSDDKGTNEATAIWLAGDYYGTDGSASGIAGYDFADAHVTTTDKTVTVTDNRVDLSKLPGGNQVIAPATGSFSYSIEYTSTETGACKSFKNVASITDDGQPKTDEATVEICKGADLAVSKNVIASLTRTYAWDIVKDRQGESKVYVDPKTGKATVNYSVVLSAGMGNDSEWLMTGTIKVQNPNDWDVSLTGVTDAYPTMSCSLVPAPAGADLVIPADGSQEYDYTCTSQTKPDYDGTNTATATWNATAAGTPKGSAEKKVTVVEADWSKKLVNDKVMVVDDGAGKGDPQQWGPFTWESDWVSDPIRYSLELPGKPGECVPYRNTATVFAAKQAAGGYVADTTKALTSHYADVEVCWPMDMNIDKTVNASYGLQYHWQIDKSVDKTTVELTDSGDAKFTYTVKAVPSGSSTSGYAMSGTITVKNPYPQGGPSVTATVTDTTTVGGGATCTVAGGQSVTLAAGESKTLSYSCTFTSQPSSSGTNTATISWVGPDGKPDEAKVTVPVSFHATGGGNSTVTVTDNLATPSTLGTATWNASGTPTVFTYSLTHKGVDNSCVDYTNTATITQTGQSDSQVVTVCDQGDLVVTKSVEASYDRTFEWDITKVADRDRLDTEQGEPGTVNYTVGVTPDGYVDSGWEMTGAVTVLNPNAYKDVTIELTDVPDLGEGASCVFDETADFLVEAGETRTFTYTCSFEQQPAYDGSNTVIVDWGAGKVSTTTDVEFELDEATDETVTVTDDMVEPSELGTVTWDEDGQTVEFEYALEHEGRPDVCETVTNTATIVETGQSAQADVLVCGPEILPAEEEVPPKPRPPAILPETGAQAGLGLWTTLGGLMVALGVALLALRRRNAS